MLLAGVNIQTTHCGNNPDVAGAALVMLPVFTYGAFLGLKQLASSDNVLTNIIDGKITPIAISDRLKIGGALTVISSALLAFESYVLYTLFFTPEDFGWSK